MDAITKTFLTLFCLLIATFTSVGLIVGALNSSAADRFISDAAEAISAGNQSDGVISEWVAEANEKGYELTCTKKDTDGDGHSDVVSLSMDYEYKIPYLNATSNKHTIKAYAR